MDTVTEDSNLVKHAERELRLSGQYEEDPEFSESLIAAVRGFASYGHSGGSAMAAVAMLERLLRFQTLSPITSDPDEWMDVSEYMTDQKKGAMWQSRRDPSVFSTDGGKTWKSDDETEKP